MAHGPAHSRSLHAELAEVMVQVSPAQQAPLRSRDPTEYGMRPPGAVRAPGPDAIDQGMQRRDVLAPLCRCRRQKLGSGADARPGPGHGMHQEAATQLETQQPRINLDLALTEPECEPPAARLDVAERHAQLVGNVADQLRRTQRSPEGNALRREPVDPGLDPGARGTAEEGRAQGVPTVARRGSGLKRPCRAAASPSAATGR